MQKDETCRVCYRGRTAAFNTKIGLSICTTIGWCSLCDEPSNFGRVKTIVGLLENRGVSGDLSEEIKSIEFAPRRNYLQGDASPDTRIFSPLAVAGLCVTIGHYWYLFKRQTAVSAGRFYRFEHIVSFSSSKVVAK